MRSIAQSNNRQHVRYRVLCSSYSSVEYLAVALVSIWTTYTYLIVDTVTGSSNDLRSGLGHVRRYRQRLPRRIDSVLALIKF